jgi:plasmid stabilization system protein ParE
LRRRLRVSRQAADQIREAARWWRDHRSARDLFSSEIARGFDLITAQPGIGIRVAGRGDAPDLRRLHLPRIRYYIYYAPAGPDSVEVVAVWHSSRGTPPDL